MTLGEIGDRLSAHYERERIEERRLIAAAWYGAAFERTKHLPELESIIRPELINRELHGAELERRRQEHEELVTAAKLAPKKRRKPRWRKRKGDD